MENKMEYTVKWIINPEITVKAANKDEAETNIKNQLKALIEKIIRILLLWELLLFKEVLILKIK